MSDLNLLPSEAKFQAEKIRLKKVLNNVMWVLGGGWLVLVIILLTVNLLSQLNLNQLNKKLQQSAQQYKNLAGEMLINQTIKQQAKVVAVVLQQRFEYGSSMEKVKSIFSDKIIIEDLELGEAKKYKIQASVTDPANFDEVEIKIEDINKGKLEGVKFAELKNIEINRVKGWDFALEVTLL